MRWGAAISAERACGRGCGSRFVRRCGARRADRSCTQPDQVIRTTFLTRVGAGACNAPVKLRSRGRRSGGRRPWRRRFSRRLFVCVGLGDDARLGAAISARLARGGSSECSGDCACGGGSTHGQGRVDGDESIGNVAICIVERSAVGTTLDPAVEARSLFEQRGRAISIIHLLLLLLRTELLDI